MDVGQKVLIVNEDLQEDFSKNARIIDNDVPRLEQNFLVEVRDGEGDLRHIGVNRDEIVEKPENPIQKNRTVFKHPNFANPEETRSFLRIYDSYKDTVTWFFGSSGNGGIVLDNDRRNELEEAYQDALYKS